MRYGVDTFRDLGNPTAPTQFAVVHLASGRVLFKYATEGTAYTKAYLMNYDPFGSKKPH